MKMPSHDTYGWSSQTVVKPDFAMGTREIMCTTWQIPQYHQNLAIEPVSSFWYAIGNIEDLKAQLGPSLKLIMFSVSASEIRMRWQEFFSNYTQR